jgi:hypothetical protein
MFPSISEECQLDPVPFIPKIADIIIMIVESTNHVFSISSKVT